MLETEPNAPNSIKQDAYLRIFLWQWLRRRQPYDRNGVRYCSVRLSLQSHAKMSWIVELSNPYHRGSERASLGCLHLHYCQNPTNCRTFRLLLSGTVSADECTIAPAVASTTPLLVGVLPVDSGRASDCKTVAALYAARWQYCQAWPRYPLVSQTTSL